MIPNKAISDYYKQKIKGVCREIDGITIVQHSYSSPEDKTIMSRLVNDIDMQKVWEQVTNEQEQIIFFECAFAATLDYKKTRSIPQGYSSKFIKEKSLERAKSVKNLLKSNGKKNKRLVQQASEMAKKLSALLYEIQSLGNTGARYPDKALNSPNIQEELAWLIEKADNFDFDNLHTDDSINEALSSPEHSLVKDYLRGFIYRLNESKFCLKNPNYYFLAYATNAALDIQDADYNTAYKVFNEIKK